MAQPDSTQHPGTVLRKRFMVPHGLSAEALSTALGVPMPRLEDVLAGQRSIGAEVALRLGRYFGTSPLYWMNLQSRFDLHVTAQVLGDDIDREVRPLDQTTSRQVA